MKRTVLLAVVLTLTLGLVGSAFAAKGHKNNAREPGGKRFEVLHQVLDKLDLSADQTKSIEQIMTDAQAKLREVREQARASGDKDAARAQVRSTMQQMLKDIAQQLTPEQKAQFREQMKQIRQQNKASRESGAPTTQPKA